VVGHLAEQVIPELPRNTVVAEQRERLGTGHAVAQAEEFIKQSETVIVLCGDTPLIRGETLKAAIKYKEDNGCSAVLLSADLENPRGYGRVVKDNFGAVLKIVEEGDADSATKKITEINAGAYIFDSADLLSALSRLDNNNSQGEYYLTDTIGILIFDGKKVKSFMAPDSNEILGINDKVQLSDAGAVMKKRLNGQFMRDGVIIEDPDSTYIEKEVKIAPDTVILPNTRICGNTEIGANCVIGPNTVITGCKIGGECEVLSSVLTEAVVGNNVHIGPFAYLRPKSRIGGNVKIGDFVEIKNANIGDGTKVSHLTYIGDADVGKNCNFGCGTVVVNYNGTSKFLTTVGDNAFIGCNTNLVSPVNVGEFAYTAAGSTITKDIPGGSLGIARAKQEVKEGWVERKGYLKK
jgi:bifunctional UDP-N-acetylglucosamine pyrophosphorylase/glucosamine-1-phosphate N-acetyltransferase